VRLTGQDAGRGTFTHRHAVLHDQNRERWDAGTYVPLQNISEGQAPFTVIDSVLSEEAVLGFEYGYSTAEPNTLTIWEAQFGDFVNGAQVVIDQFISSGEVKWGRASGLVMMLPHGYEGQGPEHSSARPERFLQLCADNNMQVVQPTTGAQIFHLLRRQMVRQFRKPLVIMTPKSLLRNKDAGSPLSDLAKGAFQTVIGEVDDKIDAKKVKRVIACSGKVYYDLVNTARPAARPTSAIIRVEQLYPFPHKSFAAELKKFPNATEVVWAQDEPQNQGPMVPDPAQHLREPGIGPAPGVCGPSGFGLAGCRLLRQALRAAEGTAGNGILEAQGLHPDQIRVAARPATSGAPLKTNTEFYMAQIEVKVPVLSESVAEATLLAWHKKVGEQVARDENLIDIETDKVVLELPAPSAGVIIQIIKGDGAPWSPAK
jgi:biotin carboxyl carrier protein